MNEDKKFYSIPEFAGLLGISRIAVFKQVKKGRIEAIRIGRNWAVPASALKLSLSARNIIKENTMKAVSTSAELEEGGEDDGSGSMDSLGWD